MLLQNEFSASIVLSVHSGSWCIPSLNACCVSVHSASWCIPSLNAFCVSVHLESWYILGYQDLILRHVLMHSEIEVKKHLHGWTEADQICITRYSTLKSSFDSFRKWWRIIFVHSMEWYIFLFKAYGHMCIKCFYIRSLSVTSTLCDGFVYHIC